MNYKNLKLILFCLIAMVSSKIMKAQGNINDSLIAYWNFDDSTANDKSGNGHNGTKVNYIQNTVGIHGNGFHFNGSSYIEVNGTGLALGTRNAWSISLWYYGDTSIAYPGVQPLVCKMPTGTGSTDADYYVFSNSGNTVWGNGNASDTGSWLSIKQASLRHWHHLVVTYKKLTSGFNKNFYVDGNLVKSGIGYTKAAADTVRLFLGYSWDGNGQHFLVGDMDEVRIYNRELSDCDVQALNKFGNVLMGTISQSNGNPLKNTKIDAVVFNPTDTTVKSIASTTSDSFGHYCLTVFDTNLNLIASPDSNRYSNQLPTYYDSAIDFSSAKPISIKNGKNVINFSTLSGTNPGGSGFIGGKVYYCVNCKQGGTGAPASGLKIILTDANGSAQKYTYTDKNGVFSFGNLSISSYKIYVDRPNVTNSTSAPKILLSTSKNKKGNLTFTLYPTYLEIDTLTSGIQNLNNFSSDLVRIYPNPANKLININFPLFSEPNTNINLFNLIGEVLISKSIGGNIENTVLDISELKRGIYFIEVKNTKSFYRQKLIVE